MSSISTKAGSSRRSERTSDYPTAWSEWSWNGQYNCDVRYRLKAGSRYSLETERLGLTTPQMITSTNMDRYNRLSQTLSRAAEDMRIPNQAYRDSQTPYSAPTSTACSPSAHTPHEVQGDDSSYGIQDDHTLSGNKSERIVKRSKESVVRYRNPKSGQRYKQQTDESEFSLTRIMPNQSTRLNHHRW